ncbi:prolipoprotein diacylglyceryl transferase [Paenibacillus sp. FSL R7-0652]|uniref:prolipoprotein diacylglyceryl transferase n=1 Tax=Paenibacillus sp. FSL R7-0652 TaxID=2921687 RepID=UPI00315AF595
MDTLLLLNPIAFSIGALKVHWYGLILGTAALLGLLLLIREGKRYNIPQEVFMDMVLWGVPSAIISARIYFVAFKWEDYKDNFWDVFKIWNGGIAIYGALIGAVICGFIFFRHKGYNFWRMADICAPGLLVGQMIGRWGNYVNQEAYGGPVEESFLRDKLHLPDFIVNQMNVEGVFRHPAFLYESVWCFVGLILLFVLRRQKFMRSGELFMSYFIWYSVGRFFIEALRTDSLAFQAPDWIASFVNGLWSPMTALGFEQGYLDPAYGNVRISQLLSLGIIAAAVVFIVVRRVTGKANARYSDPIVSSKVPADDLEHTGKAAGVGEKGTATSSPAEDDSKQVEDKKE